MKIPHYFLLSFAVILFMQNVFAQDSLNVRRVGQLSYPFSTRDVAVAGNSAFVATRSSGLKIVDITNPLTPNEIGSYDTPGEAIGVVVSNNVVYIADGDSGVRIIDATDPTMPFELSYYNPSAYVYNLVIIANYAYVVCGDGLRIVDVSNPSAPLEIGTFDSLRSAIDITLEGNYAFVGDDLDGLFVLDVSNPAQPRRINWEPISGYLQAVQIYEHNLYMAIARSGWPWTHMGLQVMDISDPIHLTEICFYTMEESVIGVTVSQGRAFVAGAFDGLRVIDVSDLPNLLEVGYYVSLNYATRIVINNNYAYVAEDSYFSIYDCSQALPTNEPYVSTPNNFSLSQNFPNPFNPTTEISFDMPHASLGSLKVFNLLGQEVAELVNENLSAGTHKFVFDGKNLASGVYLYRLETNNFSETKKMVLLK